MRVATLSTLGLLLFLWGNALAQAPKAYSAIYSGIPWFDDHGNVISAHGANIVFDKGRYYLFGEAHSDTSNAFTGFNCYSSADLYNWTFERIALPVQPMGKLGPNRVGERPKVMRCPKTGEYIMFMHVDTLGYRDQFTGYATSNTITGPYTFKGPILFTGKPIQKWDMGTFQDQDGRGYVLLHGGDIYRLSEDYRSVTEQVNKAMERGFESPTIFHHDSLYYFLGSNLSSWERNDNYYYTATSLQGPWTRQGLLAPEGTLTWNSQATFVLPITGSKGTTYLFMGDRWAFPKQASAATYVWQPLTVRGGVITMPTYQQAWQINTTTGQPSALLEHGTIINHTDRKSIIYTGSWQSSEMDSLPLSRSDEKGASFSVKFRGTQIGWYGLAEPQGGFARVTLHNSRGKLIRSALIDMYCKYPLASLRFLSAKVPRDQYTLTVSVTGEHGTWSDKKGTKYGSTGYGVSLTKLMIDE